MRTLTRWEPFRGATSLQDQVNRLFNDVLERTGEESSLTAWAPSVDIYETDRKSTRLNSSHANISYAVFCLKKKKNKIVGIINPCADRHNIVCVHADSS